MIIFFMKPVIIHFWDKPYQEINPKSDSNAIIICNLGKMLSDLHMSRLIFLTLLVCA